jgi:hypothetical protein
LDSYGYFHLFTFLFGGVLTMTKQEFSTKYKRLIQEICDLVYLDNSVDLEETEIAEALYNDMVVKGAEEPTDEQLADLVLGNDSGEVPMELRNKYATLDAYLESVLT